jgi:hypothetical protein
MAISHALTVGLLQATTLPDTLVARMLPHRDLFDWTSGILQLIVLVLGIGMLIALILLLLSIRVAVTKAHEAIERLSAETKPLIKRATEIADDAREVVAMVRTDAERVTDAATAVTEQLLAAADITAQRVNEVNAVIDVLQAELEQTAIETVSAIRGVRVGTRALADHFIPARRSGLPIHAAADDELALLDESADDFDDQLDDAQDDDRTDDLADEDWDDENVRIDGRAGDNEARPA